MSQTAMKCLCAILLCALATAADDESQHTTPKVQVTRTTLHVARSLDPDSMETVNVRTRNGDIATLIVRKRGGKSSLVLPPPVSIMSSSINVLQEEEKREGKSEDVASSNIPAPVTVKSSAFLTEEDNEQSGKSTDGVISIVAPPKDFRPSPPSSLDGSGNVYNDESSREKKTVYIPPPVYVRSSPMSIKGEQHTPEDFWKRGRSVMHVDSDGIPVIHGVRMPDDESDRQTWRNARVINGILVPYDKTSNKIESEDKQEITRKATVHLEDAPKYKKAAESARPVKPFLHNEHPAKTGQYTYPHGSDTHARILEYINTVNQREAEKRSNVPPRARMVRFNAARRSDENVSERSTSDSETQARVLHFPGSSIYPTSLLYTPPSAKTSRVSFEEGVRTPVLQYAHPELGVQPAKVMTKQDEAEELEESKQDNSRADRDKTNALTLAYFAQDIHSDRSPYAYEPGLETNEEQQPDVTVADSNAYKRSSNSEHEFSSQSSAKPWPKSSLAYLHEPQSSDDSYGLANDKYIKRYPYYGYNNVHSGNNKGSRNRYKGPISEAGYSKHPFGIGHYTIHTHMIQDRPFWERIGDTIREHVQTSMEKVSDMTRPVVEPLMEATHKISHNLGFASEDNRNIIQDKVGSTVAAYPVLLPALGLVAGGAALGLGAVAVGRYLDVDVMKRRIGLREDDSEKLQAEHKRALESIVKELSERESAREGGAWVVAEEFKNSDEQQKVLESAFRALHDGQQISDQYDRRRKALENNVRDVKGEWTTADESIKQHDLKIIEDVIRSLKTPKAAAGDGTWVFVKNVNPREKERMQRRVHSQGVWSRVDDVRNVDDHEKETIESIVETLAEQEGIGHRQGSWIVTEEGGEHENGKWIVDNDSITPNERQIKTRRSPDDKVIFLVEHDPESQSSEKISMGKLDVSNTQVRSERQFNRDIFGQIGQKLPEGSVGNFHIVQNDHRLIKRSAQEATINNDVTLHQLPAQSDHVISKRSSDNSQKPYNKEDVIKLHEGEQYLDNILHSLESSQQEILASMARLDDHRGDWSNTPCAKKIFCDVMVKQPADALMLMEKKMATFLSLIQPNEVVSYHLSDVMDAVKRHDCSEFTCPGAASVPTFEYGPR